MESYTVNHEVDNWLCDLFPLRTGLKKEKGEFFKIPIEKIRKIMGCKGDIDFVFALNKDVLAAVCLGERVIVTCQYREEYRICDTYIGKKDEPWLDIVCSEQESIYNVPSLRSQKFGAYSLFLLTEQDTLIRLLIDPSSYHLSIGYRIKIDQKQQYKKILVCSRPHSAFKDSPDSTVYFWAPDKKMLRKYNLYKSDKDTEGTARLKNEVKVKLNKPRLPQESWTSDLTYDAQAVTLCLDEKENSVICADQNNHILFECSLKNSDVELLCGQWKPGRSDENMETSIALLNAPCSPLVLRPNDFISDDLFSPFAKGILRSGKSIKRPRLVLICDVGNHAVRKIWQFPACPQAQDLASLDRIYTLLGDYNDADAPVLLNVCCDNPKALFLGSQGRLTITTETYAYVLAAGVVSSEEKSIQSNVNWQS